MAEYKLYFLDLDGHIQRRVDLNCPSEDDAIRVSRGFEGWSMELWKGANTVAKFQPGAEPVVVSRPQTCATL